MAKVPRTSVRRRSYKKRASVKKTSKPSKVFKQKVLKVIHQQAENKISQNTNNSGLSTSVITVPDAPRTTGVDCFQIVPNVSSSPVSGTFYRTGEKIKVQKMKVKGYYYYTPSVTVSSTVSNHMLLRIMCVQPRNVRTLPDIQSNVGQWIQNLLQNGSTTQQFSASVVGSAYYPFNKENIIVYYDKLFQLDQNFILQVTASGEAVLNTKGIIKHFEFSLPVKGKTLKYDQSINSGLTPTDFNPVLMCGIVQQDGTTGSVTNGKLFYTVNMEWEDL